jgi:hypothetical protein
LSWLEAKYNYFKLLDSNGQLTQADSRDTYQQVLCSLWSGF